MTAGVESAARVVLAVLSVLLLILHRIREAKTVSKTAHTHPGHEVWYTRSCR